jgi:hypothetical protein
MGASSFVEANRGILAITPALSTPQVSSQVVAGKGVAATGISG